MTPQEPFDTEKAQEVREKLAIVYKDLESMIDEWPEHGQFLSFALNNTRDAFMNIGFGTALTKGLNPLANKVEPK